MTLRRLNNLLLAAIILVNGYVIIGPFVPAIVFHVQSHTGRQRQLTHDLQAARNSQNRRTAPLANHIIIPSMLLDQPILEGPESQQYKILDRGIWRFQWSSTPDKGGNTVLIGHRFTYTNPRGVFYYLNKVKPGDQIGVWWNNRAYIYKVASITEVPPTDTAVEAPSKQAELTLFTCTPLWLPRDRLVVVAKLEAGQ